LGSATDTGQVASVRQTQEAIDSLRTALLRHFPLGSWRAPGLRSAGRRRAAPRSLANSIGADSYCRDAAVAVETAKQYMAKRQGSALAARA